MKGAFIVSYFNIAAFALALLGACLNLFWPFFFSVYSVKDVILLIPDIFRYGLSGTFSQYFAQMPKLNLGGVIFIALIIIFLIILITMPYTAITSGHYALKRRQDIDYVSTLKLCYKTMLTVGIVLFFLPMIVKIFLPDPRDYDPTANFFITMMLDKMLPYTTPLVWSFIYWLAALCAEHDRKLLANESASTSQPTQEQNINFRANDSYSTQERRNNSGHDKNLLANESASTSQPTQEQNNNEELLGQIHKFYEQFRYKTGKIFKYSMQTGRNLFNTLKDYLNKKLADINSHKTNFNSSEIIKNDNEDKYQEIISLRNNIADSYNQNRVRIQDYRKIFEILSTVGDYRDTKEISQDILAKLRNIRSKFTDKHLAAKPELKQKLLTIDNLINKFSSLLD